MASEQQISTKLTQFLGIRHPVMLAGMHIAAGPKLAAAVANAGGFGSIGGLGYTPDELREQIRELKSYLDDPNAPFGVDLLLPQVGGTARPTNHDYTKGQLDELIDIIIESGARLFISAVGVPPKHVVDKLHAAGLLYMNMIGHPKHVAKCMAVGVDILCASGTEAGGHTGNIPTSVLVPVVSEMVRGKKSPGGNEILVVAAGGIWNGNGLASALMLGASGAWLGTRFVLATESKASEQHKTALKTAGWDDNQTTLIYTGRPLRVRTNDYIKNWEENRSEELKTLCKQGNIPVDWELENHSDRLTAQEKLDAIPLLMGKSCGAIDREQPAKEIVDEIVDDAAKLLRQGGTFLVDAGAPKKIANGVSGVQSNGIKSEEKANGVAHAVKPMEVKWGVPTTA